MAEFLSHRIRHFHDALVTNHLVHFALPKQQRADANQAECTDVACEEASKQSRRLRPVDACPPTAVGTVSITLACNCHDCSSHGQVGGTL